ncbi:NADH dehydrogenase [ubiquinone] 1 alpha subcomplex subunit 5 isoform X1 [Anser cygnoides]|uniref:NADH dehydrogenase [ubiquinone] 1 alpha subcomplex subunit 5 isoform X1 n=1 Tax=Anser cygnoides TaxID=8845 RepID=UPI0020099AB8|nr:NADH dehydrogenase [ubiquinone] 1 alpha subcomplex subunit 5 isoform X1 [Anser cygnoides]
MRSPAPFAMSSTRPPRALGAAHAPGGARLRRHVGGAEEGEGALRGSRPVPSPAAGGLSPCPALPCPAGSRGGSDGTTGLVGLAVAENPHERLRILYAKILGVLQNIPKDAAYRKYTEQIVNQRLNLVQTETDVQKLQDKLNSGQIEEVIVQAENELSLSRKMLQWKPWEPLVEEPPSNQWRWPI